jgi:hypothetical protein
MCGVTGMYASKLSKEFIIYSIIIPVHFIRLSSARIFSHSKSHGFGPYHYFFLDAKDVMS